MKRPVKILTCVAAVLVFAIAISCLHVFAFIGDRDGETTKNREPYSFPILGEIYEGEWLVEELDQDAPVTLAVLADILYTIAGKPELMVPESLTEAPAFSGKDVREVFGDDPATGEAYSDSAVWCLLNGVFCIEGNFEIVPDPDDTAAKYNKDNYFHDWIFRMTEEDERITDTVNGEYILHSVKPAYSVGSTTEVTCNDAAVALYRLTEECLGVDMSDHVVRSYDLLVSSDFRLYDKMTLYAEEGEVISSSASFVRVGGKTEEKFTVDIFGEILAAYIDKLGDIERLSMRNAKG